ncbi:MAG: tRNA (adenosine(37)-N6)-threonylcarbamoyltransferase complex ATPase subunit type 1 TsaE [Wenzhouxiangella sp.]|nr:MAG: tRNA (adenosine(37)-N6)-threonylcarbamoyltransferase complex ATPase subunit type 1 TsaE [Wenzhouxiangella sp.]
MSEIVTIPTEQDMLDFGVRLSQRLAQGGVVYLSGDLGVGKTTLVRGLLRALGHEGRVKSPSYGLIESYKLEDLSVHHLDLYRLGDAEEIEYLGIADLLDDNSLLLVEWAEKGGSYLPLATMKIRIQDLPDHSRHLEIS